MTRFSIAISALALAPLLAVTGCVAPVGPVEVTRFHLPQTAALGQGTIVIEPAPGLDGSSLEFGSYAAAVTRQLTMLGYTVAPAGSRAAQVAQVRLQRDTLQPQRNRSPVSVGVGGNTGSYGSGVGVGLGIDLSGPPPAMVDTELGVTIRDRASDQSLWEGRASFAVRSSSPLANSSLGAAKMTEALFKGFPGQSGETIRVK